MFPVLVLPLFLKIIPVLNDSVEYAKYCLDTFLKNQPKGNDDTLTKAWNNVKERHWGTIK